MFTTIFNNQAHYAYILGLYLADGSISHFPRTKRLRISLHSENNKEQIERAVKCLQLLFPENNVSIFKKGKSNCVDVSVYNSKLDQYFPQHGSGRKHDRVLILTNWQDEIIKKYKSCFLHGLFDGDGSLYMNRTRGVECAQFTNKSQDILKWFKEGIEPHNITYCETYPKSKNGIGNILIQNSIDVNKLKAILKISQNLL